MPIIRASFFVCLATLLMVSCGGGDGGTSASTPTAPTQTASRVIGVSGNLAFGNITVGQSSTATLTISNTGNAALNVSGLATNTSLVDVLKADWTSGVVAAGGSRQVTISFTPTAAQSYSGSIAVNGDQTAGSNTVSVSGVG